jgi:hypothetical protein
MLKDASGALLTNTVGVTFAIYSEQTGGTPLWQETQNVQFSQGRYAVFLGESASAGIPAELFVSGQPRWLGAKALLPGEEEQPRVLLASVPYALKAVDADTLGGLPASAFMQTNSGGASGIVMAPTTTADSGHRSGLPPSSSTVTTPGGTVGTIPEFDTSTDIKDSPLKDSGGEIVTQNLENVRYADQYPGSDIGAKVIAAYASCPAAGCHIRIPGNSTGYSFSTPIVFATNNKPAVLDCDPGSAGLPAANGTTELIYTPTSGAAVTFNDGGFTGAGMNGCTLIGPSKSGSTLGLVCGSGSGSCVGHSFQNNDISGFGTGLSLSGTLSFLDLFIGNTVHDNGVNLLMGSGGGNENNRFFGGMFSEQTSSENSNCVNINSTTPYDVAFYSVSFDQCGVTINGTGHRVKFFGSHLENPNGASATPFITVGAGCSACFLELFGTDIQEDGSGTGRTGLIEIDNTTTAYVYVHGGRFYAGTESAPYIIYNTAGNNVVSVFNTEKANISADVNNALEYSTMEAGYFVLGGASSLRISDQGTCTMNGTTGCPTQSLSHPYGSAPNCFANWTGGGTLTGVLKVPSTTTTVTPASSVTSNTAVVNWVCLGK